MQPFNKYYPPDWTPEKGSINKHYGKHALGDRARKIDEGILIVRFELPFNIWCSGCENHIGQGVRYNAQKKKIGNYYSTPILQFRMKCHLCDNWIEIHTDPKNAAYVVASGARKKVEEWKAEDTDVIQLQDEGVKERLESDPMYRLEHGIEDKKKIEQAVPRISQLQHLNESLWADPYARSQQLRKQFRQEKKNDKRQLEATEKVRDKHSLQIELLPETSSDVIAAKSVNYNASHLLDKKRIGTAVSPLFGQAPSQNEDKQLTELSQIAKLHTRLKTDPFYNPNPFSSSIHQKQKDTQSESNTKRLMDVHVVKPTKKKKRLQNNDQDTTSGVALVSYTDSDTE